MSTLRPLNIAADTDPRIVEEVVRLLKKHAQSNNMPAPHTQYQYGGVTYAEAVDGVRLFFTDRVERWHDMLARLLPALERLERYNAPYQGPEEIWVVSMNIENGPQPARWQAVGLIGSGAEARQAEAELNQPWPDTYKVEPQKVYSTAKAFLAAHQR